MTPSKEVIAAFRYGYGFYPNEPRVQGAAELLGQLEETDPALEISPSFDPLIQINLYRDMTRAKKTRKKETGQIAADAKVLEGKLHQQWKAEHRLDFNRSVLRPLLSPHSFRERLIAFWEDHFTISVRHGRDKIVGLSYSDVAIRPHVAGRFEDMLRAVLTHPSMLYYLNQDISMGPTSAQGKRRNAGLNENLARELLELHTLGAGGPYTQDDIVQLAELLTGLQVGNMGTNFTPRRAEPGSHIVLGVEYGTKYTEDMRYIYDFLADISRHPATANHLAHKLVTHFIGGDNPELVSHIAQMYLASDGNLKATYEALLEHPDAWRNFGQKVKWPLEYVVSGMRAFGLQREDVEGFGKKDYTSLIENAYLTMGQPHRQAPSPEGWPEQAEGWITPQGLAGRVQWAMLMSHKFAGERDPRKFLDQTLGGLASEELTWAVARAASQPEALGLVLASPEFNRR